MARILRSESSLRLKEGLLRREAAVLRRIRAAELAATGALALAGVAVWARSGGTGLLWMAAFVAFLTIGHRLKQRENESDADKLDLGAGGEREMAERLAAELPDDTLIVNDIVLAEGRKTAQIDHFVLSPRGIFIVETKTWGGRISGRMDSPSWTLQGHRGRPLALKNPVWQNRRQAGFVRRMLRAEGLDWPDVQSIVAMAAPRCELAIEGETRGIVVRAAEVAPLVRGYENRRGYREAEIRRVLARLGVASVS